MTYREFIEKFPDDESVAKYLIEKRFEGKIVCPFCGKTEKVYQFLKKNYAITLTPSGGAMRERMLRVGHLGNLKLCDYDALCDGLREYGK